MSKVVSTKAVTYDDALEYVSKELGMYFGANSERAVQWMMTPNPMLGDVVPAWLMLYHPNGPQKLITFVKNCRAGDIA